MAPRPPQQRRTIAPQEHIYELGVAGRYVYRESNTNTH